MVRDRTGGRYVHVLQPWHYTALLMSVQGRTYKEIAQAMNHSQDHVKGVLTSAVAKKVLESIRNQTVDTMREIQAAAQIYAPEMLERLVGEARTALESSTRVRAQKAVLEIAGHTPVHHMVVERPDEIEEEFKGLTDEEIKAKVLGKKPADKGPDGKMLS